MKTLPFGMLNLTIARYIPSYTLLLYEVHQKVEQQQYTC
jgi:hypothetical protein